MSPIKPFRSIMALALPLGGITPAHAASFASYAASEMIPSTVLVSSTCSAPPTTSTPPTTSSSNTGYSPPGYIPPPSGNRASTSSEACLSNTTFLEPYKFSKPISYAYEQFGNTKKKLDYPFRVRYAPTLGKAITSIKDGIFVTFTLNGRGVTWGRNLTSNNLSLQKADGTIVTTPTDIAIIKNGFEYDNSVTYVLFKGRPLATDETLDFSFQIGNVNRALTSLGNSVTITATITSAQSPTAQSHTNPIAPVLSTVLANAVEGLKVEFNLSAEEKAKPAFISIVGDMKSFEGAGKISDTQVSYGRLHLTNTAQGFSATMTCPPRIYLNGGTVSCNQSVPWSAQDNMKTGRLVIENGNFSASKASSDGLVYIDVPQKIIADTFSSSAIMAEWDLEVKDLKNLFNNPGMGNIILNVNGETEITQNRFQAPRGTLSLQFNEGRTVTRSATLRHLKANGTVCTLFNIPPPDALDIVQMRITNMSPSVDGFVKGTLVDGDGKVIFQQKTLVEQGNLKPHQTVRLQMEDLTADGSSWTGRAVLKLFSNVPYPQLQIFGFLRAREVTGFPEAPLMNMSRGASGQPCE